MTEFRKRKIVESYLEGQLTNNEIADAYGICERMVYRVVKRAGHKLNRSARITEEHKRQLLEEYLTYNEATCGSLAFKYGHNSNTVARILKAYEVILRPGRRPIWARRRRS